MIDAGATTPVAASQLRRHNTALVLRTLREHGALSRTLLARHTGLAKATVGAIVGELCSLGAVTEEGSATPSRGRPSRPVRLDGQRFVALGIEVNVDYLAIVALDLSGRTVVATESSVGRGRSTFGSVTDRVRDTVVALAQDGKTLLGLTVAVPGLVGPGGERVEYAPNLDWSQTDLAAALESAIGPDVAVRVDNDANCGALAEARYGVARGLQNLLYLTGTVGIGAGVLADGVILRGALGYAGEVGHMRIGDPNATCGCGRRGCWEAVVGLRAMLAEVGVDVGATESSYADPIAIATYIARLARSNTGSGAEPDVRSDGSSGVRADAGTGSAVVPDRGSAPPSEVDAEAVRVGLDAVAAWLASGASVLANALNPSAIVLGGYFVPLGEWLLPPVRAALERDVFAGRGTRVELSTLGLRAAATGAAVRVLNDVYDGATPLPS